MPETDLVALVLELEAQVATFIDDHMGRALQQVGLSILGQHDPELAQRIHDTDDLKPFSVSGLMRGERLFFGKVEVGTRTWIRLTGLSSETALALLSYARQLHLKIQAEQAPLIEIDRMPWRIVDAHLSDSHAWAGVSSYQTLIERQRQARPPESIRLRFITPTTFRSNAVNLPLPLPHLVFGGLLTRWTQFTPHRLRDLPQNQLDAYIAHHLVLSQYQLQTILVRGKQGGREIGFVGEVTYDLLRVSDHLHKHDPELEALIQAQSVWFARTIGLLADLARWSGVGRKTTTGLGMASEL